MSELNVPYDLSERILDLIDDDGGIMLSQIEKSLETLASRRTLSRRLDELVRSRKIDRIGKARSAVYRPLRRIKIIPGERMVDRVQQPRVFYNDSDIPLSKEALSIRQQVSEDLALRPRVGYRRSFLEDYRPNETRYLSATDRQLLASYDVLYGAALPEGSYGRALTQHLLIDLAWSSSRLEGSSFSRMETQRLIEQGIAAENKSREELQIILNHKEAIEFMLAAGPDVGFNAYTFMNLHALLAENLLGAHDLGRLRAGCIFISRSAYQPLADPKQIAEMFALLVEKAGLIRDPFEQAFFALVHLPYLQPFWDVNKRVSRIAANIPLIRAEKCPLSFVDVPRGLYLDAMLGVYELNRFELLKELFIWAYDRSCRDYENLRDGLPPVNPLRLKYRVALREVIGGIVREGETADAPSIERRAASQVESADLSQFVALALAEFVTLQEGNIACYRISLASYRKWRKARKVA